MNYTGGCVVAMGGKNCIALACDLRFGNEYFTCGCATPRIFKINKKIIIGMTGLFGDISSVKQDLEYKMSLYSFEKNLPIQFLNICNILSNLLYEKRFCPLFLENIICGLDNKFEPIISSMDILGSSVFSSNFAIVGTCNQTLYGLCEMFWKPDLDLDELFEIVIHCLVTASSRNCLSGWGCMVKMISPKGIVTKVIKTKID